MQSIDSHFIETHPVQPPSRVQKCARGVLEKWSITMLVSSDSLLLSLGMRLGLFLGLGLCLASQSVLGQVFSQRPIAQEQPAGTNSTPPIPRVAPVVDLAAMSQVERIRKEPKDDDQDH